MSYDEIVSRVQAIASETGMTPAEWADALNRLTPEQIGKAMEALPTDALEFAVRFEALAVTRG